jgi:hypothetical protein
MATIGSGSLASNPYVRLGLAPGASLAEVKRAYRRVAMDVHPDHAGNGSVGTFLAVRAAYEWIVAHASLVEPGDRRQGSIPEPTVGRSARRARPMAARPTAPQSGRTPWPGGRWYWEGIRERAARR